jgi:hypothetical protein
MTGIKVELLGVKELEAKLNKLPIEVADVALGEVQDYMINVLRMYPPKNYVTRKAAYGQTFQSDKQRRWFFWALNSGAINVPYQRSQTLSQGWHKVRSGLTGHIVNYTPYAVYVMGENKQSKHEAMVGWQKVSAIVKERMDKINKIIDEAAKKAIRKLGLS